MNSLDDQNYTNRLYDELNSVRSTLMLDLKNDKECVKEKTINQKLQCVDVIIRNIIKYRNINTKEKLKQDF